MLNIFAYCSGLISLTIGNSVPSIGLSVFSGCSSLTSVTIGEGVKSVSSGAFASCKQLTDVYCYAVNVPATSSDAFKDSYIEYATLHVPAASVNAYKEAEPWKNFKQIVAIDGDTPTTPKCAKPTISYDNLKLTYSCETEGVEYTSNITDSDISNYTTSSIDLTVTYNISVYAHKSGYKDSETVTATLCWVDVEPKTEGITNSVSSISAKAILIKCDRGLITVEGADDGEHIHVYNPAGSQEGTAISQNRLATVNTHIKPGDIAIIKIGTRAVKVVMK